MSRKKWLIALITVAMSIGVVDAKVHLATFHEKTIMADDMQEVLGELLVVEAKNRDITGSMQEREVMANSIATRFANARRILVMRMRKVSQEIEQAATDEQREDLWLCLQAQAWILGAMQEVFKPDSSDIFDEFSEEYTGGENEGLVAAQLLCNQLHNEHGGKTVLAWIFGPRSYTETKTEREGNEVYTRTTTLEIDDPDLVALPIDAVISLVAAAETAGTLCWHDEEAKGNFMSHLDHLQQSTSITELDCPPVIWQDKAPGSVVWGQ